MSKIWRILSPFPPQKKNQKTSWIHTKKKEEEISKTIFNFFNAKKRPNLWEKNQGQEPDKEGKEEETQVAINP